MFLKETFAIFYSSFWLHIPRKEQNNTATVFSDFRSIPVHLVSNVALLNSWAQQLLNIITWE